MNDVRQKPESTYLRQVKHVIERHLTRPERRELRTWLRSRFDSAGRPQPHHADAPTLRLVWDSEA